MDEIKGIWIPKEIWDLDELSWTERVLISEILALSNKQECTANNEHFSNRLMVTKESASRLINKLVKLGYLKSTIKFKKNTKQVENRKLEVNWEFIINQNNNTSLPPTTLPPCEECVYPPVQMLKKEYNIEYNKNTPTAQNFSESENNSQNKPSKNLSELFEEFYKNYPNKKGKHRAYRWFKSHKPNETLVAKMIGATNLQKQTFQWKKQNGKYIPHPATWLNGGSWENEIKPEEIAHTSDKSIARFLAIELYEKLKHKTFEKFGQDKKLIDLWTLDIDNYLSLNRTKEQEDRIFYAINSLESSWIKEKIHDARSLIKNLDLIGCSRL